MIKGIIFDHDGTLINSEKMHYECWCDILQDYDVDFTLEEYINDHVGVPTLRNAEILVEAYAIDVSPAELANMKQCLSHKQFEAQPSPLMPFAGETIHSCYDAGYALAIATGAGKTEIEQTMKAYQLRHFFSAITTRDDVEQSKPAPDVYLLAQERLGLSAKDCIAIEDTQAGLHSAKAAGLRCIVVANEYSIHQDLSEADAQCQNLAEAFNVIQGL